MITTEQIKELRDSTGISVMQCKKALEETDGDMQKALVVLRQKGNESASKKSDRALTAGVVSSYVHNTGVVGTLVVLSCETDFVAKNEEFKTLARDIAMHATAMDPEYLKATEITVDAINTAKDVFNKEVADKPKELQEKILKGKLDAYFKEKILIDQPYIKDQSITIGGLIENAVLKFGERIEITKYVRLKI